MTPTDGWKSLPLAGYPGAEYHAEALDAGGDLCVDSMADIYNPFCRRWMWSEGEWFISNPPHGTCAPRTRPPDHIIAALMLLFPDLF